MAHAQLINRSGFTLIEFLVAIVILMVGMLGLLQGVNVSLNAGRQNQLRNQASLVADKWLSKELAKGFTNVSTTALSGNAYSSEPILNGFVNFSVARSGLVFQSSKSVQFTVSWYYRGTKYYTYAGGVASNNPVAQ
jgi:type IV pilus assembly protein PilV